MKIKEFIEKINEHDGMRAKDVAEGILISTPMGLFAIPKDASLYWKKADREYLSALIEEFLHTPVKERFPGKN